MTRPNVLLLLTDQQAASAMSCAGNPDLRTPAMDRIAERGVRFERAYCTQPLCVPSRASLVTGRYPHEVGVPYNLHPPECRKATQYVWMAQHMAKAGYDTAWVGKWHLPVEPEATEVHGFNVTHEVHGKKIDSLVAGHCEAILRSSRDRPLFLVASFVNPHDCCEAARDEPLPNGPIDHPPCAAQCPTLPANFEPPAGEPSVLREKVQAAYPSIYPSTQWTKQRWRQYRWQYARLVEKVDAHAGEVLAALDRSGNAAETVIIFTSDHGDGMGAHRWNQKQVLYDEVVRVPLLLSDPRGRAAAVDHHLVSMNLDLIPTLCDYAQHSPATDLPGRSLQPIVQGQAPSVWREAVFTETEFAKFGAGKTTGIKGRMVRTDCYKYIVYSEGNDREQLFHMESDAGEQHDLSQDNNHASVLHHHRDLLAAWCHQVADEFPFP